MVDGANTKGKQQQQQASGNNKASFNDQNQTKVNLTSGFFFSSCMTIRVLSCRSFFVVYHQVWQANNFSKLFLLYLIMIIIDSVNQIWGWFPSIFSCNRRWRDFFFASSLGQQYAFSRAYLNISNRQDLIIFTEKFQGYVFVDKNGYLIEFHSIFSMLICSRQRIPLFGWICSQSKSTEIRATVS